MRAHIPHQLGAEIPIKIQVSKILLGLKGTVWAPKRAAIQESYEFAKLTFEVLMGKLKDFEEQKRQLNSDDVPQASTPPAVVKHANGKGLAFKAYKEEEEASSTDSEDDSDDEIALLTRRFSKFLKFNKRKTGSPFGNKKFYKEKKDDSIPRCFRCNSKRHLNADCP